MREGAAPWESEDPTLADAAAGDAPWENPNWDPHAERVAKANEERKLANIEREVRREAARVQRSISKHEGSIIHNQAEHMKNMDRKLAAQKAYTAKQEHNADIRRIAEEHRLAKEADVQVAKEEREVERLRHVDERNAAGLRQQVDSMKKESEMTILSTNDAVKQQLEELARKKAENERIHARRIGSDAIRSELLHQVNKTRTQASKRKSATEFSGITTQGLQLAVAEVNSTAHNQYWAQEVQAMVNRVADVSGEFIYDANYVVNQFAHQAENLTQRQLWPVFLVLLRDVQELVNNHTEQVKHITDLLEVEMPDATKAQVAPILTQITNLTGPKRVHIRTLAHMNMSQVCNAIKESAYNVAPFFQSVQAAHRWLNHTAPVAAGVATGGMPTTTAHLLPNLMAMGYMEAFSIETASQHFLTRVAPIVLGKYMCTFTSGATSNLGVLRWVTAAMLVVLARVLS